MPMKNEGPAFPPFPLHRRDVRAPVSMRARFASEGQEPLCEMCGNPVIAAHCKRICLKCGFVTGCSEGI